NEWDTKLGDVSATLMTLAQIQELMAKGFEFGSHTLRHCHLDQLDEGDQWEEIFQSRSKLEAQLGRPIDTFCYPYGGYNETTLHLVREAGYLLATTCDKGHNTSDTDPVKLNRIAIRHDTSLPIFIYKMWRWYKRGR
ncbi:MAG TPA: polysaccharide deacetylase family protein, partial [Fimbriimonas sp.]|nr:polysaccharide deacetylase family protein [Fimbriimonas sp.]